MPPLSHSPRGELALARDYHFDPANFGCLAWVVLLSDEPGLVEGGQPLGLGTHGLAAQLKVASSLLRALGLSPHLSQSGVRHGLLGQPSGLASPSGGRARPRVGLGLARRCVRFPWITVPLLVETGGGTRRMPAPPHHAGPHCSAANHERCSACSRSQPALPPLGRPPWLA